MFCLRDDYLMPHIVTFHPLNSESFVRIMKRAPAQGVRLVFKTGASQTGNDLFGSSLKTVTAGLVSHMRTQCSTRKPLCTKTVEILKYEFVCLIPMFRQAFRLLLT